MEQEILTFNYPMPNQLFIITGPSGVGKTTVGTEILKQMPNLQKVVTYTTRKPRPNEHDGVDYNFISVEEFLNRRSGGDFFEHAENYGNFYGNSRNDLEKIWADGKIVMMIVDVKGAKTIRNFFPQSKTIFISPDSADNLAKRIRQRPMSDEAFTDRWAEVSEELAYADLCDFNVVNGEGELGQTVAAVKIYIEQNS